jgi:ubiquinol-cytochrome c reductase cytochrome c subunit
MRYLICVVMLASVLAAQTPPQSTSNPAAPAGNAENGKKLFMEKGCFQCHDTQGQGGDGPRLAPRPIAFTAFIKELRQPRDSMPPYTLKMMPDKEVADIYSFLAAIPAPPDVNSIPLLKR